MTRFGRFAFRWCDFCRPRYVQQNINMLGRLVQQLGTARDTPELRGQCRCQIDVVKELGGKIQDEVSLAHEK